MWPIYRFPVLLQKILHLSLLIYQYVYAFFIPLFKKRNSTYVFCIGDVKTATTSLSKALSLLGYRSIHFVRSGNRPNMGWCEFIKKTRCDAFADWPINRQNFYKILDKEFPNSKFILTIRDSESYGKSFKRFFKGTIWNIDNSKQLDKRIKKFEKRNQEIIEYFKDRPSQLVVMNIFKNDGWEKLCKFLNKPIPKKPFPHCNNWKY